MGLAACGPGLPSDFEALHLAGERVAVHTQKAGCRGQLSRTSLQRLAEDGPVHLVEQRAVKLRHLPAVKLVEEMPQAKVDQLFQRQFQRVCSHERPTVPDGEGRGLQHLPGAKVNDGAQGARCGKASPVEVTHVRRSFPPRRWLTPAAAALLLGGFAQGPGRLAHAAPDTSRPSPDGGAAAQRLVLFVTADLQGQLMPCGCSAGMRGGLGRAAAQVAEARAQGLPTLYLDAGDALFDRAGLQPDEAVEAERKAQAVAEALVAMGLAGRAVGPLDEVQGADFRRSLGLPEYAAGSANLLRGGSHPVGVVVGRSAKELAQGAARVRGQGAEFVLALYGGSLDGAVAASRDIEGVDLVVSAQDAALVSLDDESRLARSGVPVARIQSRGRALLRVDLVFDGTGRFRLFSSPDDVLREAATLDERIALLKKELAQPGQGAERKRLLTERLGTLVNRRGGLAPAPPLSGANGFTVRFIPLETTLPSDAAVDKVVAKFDEEVSALNLAWAKAHGQDCPAPAKGEAAYLGNASCARCHSAAFGVYQTTGHPHAYQALAGVHKQYRLECVACHVVGFQQPGGVCRVDRPAGREGVGCENCHGPGSLHAAQPSAQPIPRPAPTRSVCVGCHTPEDSPHFDFSVYLPRVLGPGHAAKR